MPCMKTECKCATLWFRLPEQTYASPAPRDLSKSRAHTDQHVRHDTNRIGLKQHFFYIGHAIALVVPLNNVLDCSCKLKPKEKANGRSAWNRNRLRGFGLKHLLLPGQNLIVKFGDRHITLSSTSTCLETHHAIGRTRHATQLAFCLY